MLLINSWRDMYLWNVWIETSTGDDNDLELNLAYSSAIILVSWNKKKSVTLQPVTHNGMKTSWTLRAWRPCDAAISNFSRFFSFKSHFCSGPAARLNITLTAVANQQTAQFNVLFCRWKLQKSRVVNSEWFPGEVTWQTQSSSCELSSTLAKNTTSKAVILNSDLLVFWSMPILWAIYLPSRRSGAPYSRSSSPLAVNAPSIGASSTLSRLSTFLDLLNSEQCEGTAVGVT